MKKMFKFRAALFSLMFLFVLPVAAHAHEVYVLNNAEIAHDVAQPPLNLFAVALSHKNEFLVILFLAILGLIAILGISLSRKIEKWIDPLLFKIKPYAGHIAQATIGLAILASAYYHALFGIELPFAQLFQKYTAFITIALYIAAFSILSGVYARIGSLIVILVFLYASVGSVGIYMLSYFTYLGEALVILLFGGGYKIFDFHFRAIGKKGILSALKKRKYFILRIFFSISLIYAALYAKLIHGELALNTVMKYHLTNYFHFTPLFIVLGAFLVEMMIAIFYFIGFEIRFTSLFFLTFLSMSLVFFGEAVWPHIVLIGTAGAMLVHGYDEFTIERKWYKKGKREPVF